MKRFVVLFLGFDDLHLNFVTVRPGETDYSISYVSDFAYLFDSYSDATRSIDFLKSQFKDKKLRFTILSL